MSLPLQPDLTPVSPWRRRALTVVVGFAVLTVLALATGPRLRPPRVLADGPGRDAVALGEAVRMMDGAQSRIWVAMYVVRPDDGGPVAGLLEALASARRRGVDVRVLLDLDDQEVDKNQAAVAWLQHQGVVVVQDEPKVTSHAKVILVDDRLALVGSHNWTRSAMTRNREVSVLVADRASIEELVAWFSGIPGWKTP